ncbi:DNA-binding protein [Candidatus Woesearchaeota archaeon]|nr:DNA-binding protein [Candidatus Woesearchaeota archaeon]
MKIADLKVRQGNVEIEGEISDLGEVKTFQKFGKEGKVMSATLKDDSGKIILSLWNDDVDRIKVGDKVKITNGYVSEFQGEKQLTAGRFGKLEILK